MRQTKTITMHLVQATSLDEFRGEHGGRKRGMPYWVVLEGMTVFEYIGPESNPSVLRSMIEDGRVYIRTEDAKKTYNEE